MNSRQKSSQIGRIFLVLSLVGCASSTHTTNRANVDTNVPHEVRLAKDRQELDKLRAQEPEMVKQDNDDLATIMELMTHPDREPLEIRQKFNDYTRRSRDRFNDGVRKERDKFNETERKKRDEFLKKLMTERDAFYRQKPSSPQLQEFSHDQEQKRSEYFADERDRRSEYESLMREKRANFDGYLKEKTDTFNEEIRRYSDDYKERQRTLALKREAQEKARAKARTAGGAPEGVPPETENNPYQNELEEWNKVPPGPGTHLDSGDSGL